MLQSPGVELGQAELGLQDLEASFPRAPSRLGRSLGPWASQGGLAGLLRARRVPPGLGTSCAWFGDFLFREHLPRRAAWCSGPPTLQVPCLSRSTPSAQALAGNTRVSGARGLGSQLWPP